MILNNIYHKEYETNLGIDCILWEQCNNNCLHCFQQHLKQDIDINFLKTLPPILLKDIDDEIIKRKVSNIKLSLRGGELFQDSLGDEYFTEYENIISYIRHNLSNKYPNITVNFDVISNGLFKKVDRFIDFVKKTNCKVSLSYDPYGRLFTQKQKDVFLNVYNILNESGYLRDISITLTKPCIQHYINGDSDLEMFRKCDDIDINYYIPNKNWKFLLPSDDDLYNFFKWLVDNNYFNVAYIQNLIKSIINKDYRPNRSCSCNNRIIHNKGIKTTKCSEYMGGMDAKDFYGDAFETMTEDNFNIISASIGVKKRGCQMCKYYDKCQMCCWSSFNFKHYEVGECPHKRITEYIINNQQIIERFRNTIND